MSDSTHKAPPTPKGVIAYLTVSDGAGAIAFYQQAFGAALLFRQLADDGARLLHAQLAMNDGTIMISDDFPEYTGGVSQAPDKVAPRGITLFMQVDNCDRVFNAAVAAGADGFMPPADMFWGDRYARVKDPFGHVWALAHTL